MPVFFPPHQYDMFDGSSTKKQTFRVRVEHHMTCVSVAWKGQRFGPWQLSICHLRVQKQKRVHGDTIWPTRHSSEHSHILERCPSAVQWKQDIIQVLLLLPIVHIQAFTKTCGNEIAWLCQSRKHAGKGGYIQNALAPSGGTGLKHPPTSFRCCYGNWSNLTF